jgi:hypothetical protein
MDSEAPTCESSVVDTVPPIVPDTDVHADEINTEHELAKRSAEDAVAHAVRCGELLMAQKRRCGHGNFVAWVKEHCCFSHDTANIYMRTARKKTSALVFQSLRQLIESEKMDKRVRQVMPYTFSERHLRVLPAGHDVQAWSQFRQGAELVASFAKHFDSFDIEVMARGITRDEIPRFRPHVSRALEKLTALHAALCHADLFGPTTGEADDVGEGNAKPQ